MSVMVDIVQPALPGAWPYPAQHTFASGSDHLLIRTSVAFRSRKLSGAVVLPLHRLEKFCTQVIHTTAIARGSMPKVDVRSQTHAPQRELPTSRSS